MYNQLRVPSAGASAGRGSLEHLACPNHRRYGMSIEEVQYLFHDPDAQAIFENKWGITFDEYSARLTRGEYLGDYLVNGRFQRPA